MHACMHANVPISTFIAGVEEMLPGILPQLGPEGLQELSKKVWRLFAAEVCQKSITACLHALVSWLCCSLLLANLLAKPHNRRRVLTPENPDDADAAGGRRPRRSRRHPGG